MLRFNNRQTKTIDTITIIAVSARKNNTETSSFKIESINMSAELWWFGFPLIKITEKQYTYPLLVLDERIQAKTIEVRDESNTIEMIGKLAVLQLNHKSQAMQLFLPEESLILFTRLFSHFGWFVSLMRSCLMPLMMPMTTIVTHSTEGCHKIILDVFDIVLGII